MRVPLLQILLLVAVACASDPGTRPATQPPTEFRDARTGLVLRVPEGWSLAPKGIVQASFAASFAEEGAPPPRGLFGAIEDSSLAEGQMRGVVGLARPSTNPFAGSQAVCDVVLAELREKEPRSEREGTRSIGGREFCGVRTFAPSGALAVVWSAVVGPDVLILLAMSQDPARLDDVGEVFAGISFSDPTPRSEDASPAGEVIDDAQTGLRLEIPAGWSVFPSELIDARRNTPSADSQHLVFALVHDETFTAAGAEMLSFVWEPIRPDAVLPDSEDAICQLILPIIRARDAQAVLETRREIGGLSFCRFRFTEAGAPYLLFTAVREGKILRFQGAGIRADGSALDAVLDAIVFD